MELSGRTAVITGAAGGIGGALASELAAAGCGLRLTDLRADRLASVADRLRAGSGVTVRHRAVDLTQADAPARLRRWLEETGPVDLLVNNAGGGRFGPFAGAAADHIEATLLLNVRAPTLLTRELLPMLLSRPEAMIVNVSSAIARLPYPGLAVYGAAKGYLSSLSESLACELADTPVAVLCYHPGFTDTGFMEAAGMDMSRIPALAVSSPGAVAAGLRRAIEGDRGWTHSDPATRLATWLGAALPHRLRTRIFRDLFWELPPCDGA